jgi:hypothetical protein
MMIMGDSDIGGAGERANGVRICPEVSGFGIDHRDSTGLRGA